MKIVMKFGGTSVANAQKIDEVANIISQSVKKGDSVIVVVSAMAGVTDSLVEVMKGAEEGDLNCINSFMKKIEERHEEAIKSITDYEIRKKTSQQVLKKLSGLKEVLMAIAHLKEATPRTRDFIISTGELLSAPIVASKLNDIGVEAKYFSGGEAGIITDTKYGNANPLMNNTEVLVKERLNPLIKEGTVPVVTGFVASAINGHNSTLGRGGSDYSASIIGYSLDCDEIWIWTDVDGIMTTDPRIEPEASKIELLSYNEAAEMAYFGAKVLHPRTLEPAKLKNIPVVVRNTFNQNDLGTRVVGDTEPQPSSIVKAIAMIREVALITVGGAKMVGVPGIAARVFGALGLEGISVSMISQGSSEVNISFIMAVVGAGMKGTPGVAARVFRAVADESVNVRMIAQGSSELNISFVVRQEDGPTAVRAIHREFKLSKEG
jgi:aspartate kinase